MPRLKGFSLIELLIVLTIVAVLCAIAVPTYKSYVVKARVTELLTVADAYKIKVIESLIGNEASNQAVFNINTDLIDYVAVNTIEEQPTKHVIQVVAKMKNQNTMGIGIVQPEKANDALIIQLHGVETGEMLAWSCHVDAAYNNYVPKSCQNNDLAAIRLG
jgi:type IV pilus assembly protein PilA